MSNHARDFRIQHKPFFVEFRGVFIRVFHKNQCPPSDPAYTDEVSPSIKGPGLNFLKERSIPDKPFIPETKCQVGAFDAPRLVSLTGAPIKSGTDRFREVTNDTKNIVRKNHFSHVVYPRDTLDTIRKKRINFNKNDQVRGS